jgi:hypothetical protein
MNHTCELMMAETRLVEKSSFLFVCEKVVGIKYTTSETKIKAVCSFETLISTYKSTRRHNPEVKHPHFRRLQNLMSQINKIFPNSSFVISITLLLSIFLPLFFRTNLSLKTQIHVRFQVLTAASMKFRFVFWDVLPCKMIVDHHGGSTYL